METNLLVEDFLEQKTWAVIGASANRDKYGYKIYKKLKEFNYTVIPVNPNFDLIERDVCYPTIESLPIKPNVVNIITPPKITELIISQCIKADIQRVWIQPGADSESSIKLAEDNGLKIIHHRCVLIELNERGKKKNA